MTKSAIKNSQSLKQLSSRKVKLEVDIGELQIDKKEISNKLAKALARLAALEIEIDNIVNTEPMVTEHALIRFLERVMQVDLDLVRNKILTKRLLSQIMALGSGKYEIQGGHFAIVKGKSVISII